MSTKLKGRPTGYYELKPGELTRDVYHESGADIAIRQSQTTWRPNCPAIKRPVQHNSDWRYFRRKPLKLTGVVEGQQTIPEK